MTQSLPQKSFASQGTKSEFVTGWGLVCSGLFMILSNLFGFMALSDYDNEVSVIASQAFATRMVLAILGATCLVIAASNMVRWKQFKGKQKILPIMAFLGSLMLFGHEWTQLFFLHSLANLAPQSYLTLEDEALFNLYDFEAILVFAAFSLSWLALAVSFLIKKTVPKAGPWFILLGYLAGPLLGILMPGSHAALLTALIVGFGFVLMGLAVKRLGKVPGSLL